VGHVCPLGRHHR